MKAIEELNKLKDSLELVTDNDIDQHKIEAAIDMAARIGAEHVLKACEMNCGDEDEGHLMQVERSYSELKKAQEL